MWKEVYKKCRLWKHRELRELLNWPFVSLLHLNSSEKFTNSPFACQISLGYCHSPGLRSLSAFRCALRAFLAFEASVLSVTVDGSRQKWFDP